MDLRAIQFPVGVESLPAGYWFGHCLSEDIPYGFEAQDAFWKIMLLDCLAGPVIPPNRQNLLYISPQMISELDLDQ